MNLQNVQPTDLLAVAGRAIFTEAPSGSARHEYLQRAILPAEEQGAHTWLLSSNMEMDGPWSGLKDLFADLMPQLQSQSADLIARHDYELASILPALRRTLTVRNPTLTDIALENEKVRNYPADRALRIVHGLIDLLDGWYQRSGRGALVIACDDYDRAGVFVRRFFVELLRRRGQSLKITLVLAVDPGQAEALRSQFAPECCGPILQLDLPEETHTAPDPHEMAQLAQALLERVADDRIEREIQLPTIIRYWLLSDQPEQALYHLVTMFSIYTKQSLYEDALVYGEAAFQQLERYCPDDLNCRWHIVSRLYFCYAPLRRSQEALRVVEDFMAQTQDHEHLMYCCYFVAMLYARLLPQRDLAKAEVYLERGLEELAQANLPPDVRAFQTVFNRNGLALLRHFAGRYQEAIDLCQWGFTHLDAHLQPNAHRLHRSVLLYNIAQVYAITAQDAEAIAHFSMAMEMDPNYSEYYNERGNIYLALGQLDAARSDYLTAIDLSPPYPEVWTNLGQCYRLMEQLDEAIEAYSRALDLLPDQAVALEGRGQAFEGLGDLERALADYSSSLSINPKQPVVLANRAILYYGLGEIRLALADLNAAIELAPNLADLYQNRAIALADLGQSKEAAEDFHTYLRINPDAEDRGEVERKLAMLQSVNVVAA